MRSKQLLRAALAVALPLCPIGCASQATTGPSLGTANKSWTSKFSSSVKDGADKATAALTPKAEAPADPISLSTKPKKKSPDLYVAMGLTHEKAGSAVEAEKMYKKALDVAPNDANALLAYGHLQDRRGNLDEATKLYRKACKKHPDNATAQNDLGLCLHRQGKLDDSIAALREAVRLQPDRKLYRNNLATVLVEMNRRDEAFTELAAAHGAAAAHYNLGYLLQQKGDSQGALSQFQMALRTDSSLAAAQTWIDKLAPTAASGAPTFAGPVSTPASSSVDSPTIEMPSEPTPPSYYGSAPSGTQPSQISPHSHPEVARQPSYGRSVTQPQAGDYYAGEIGEVPPTPEDAGVELLPAIPNAQ